MDLNRFSAGEKKEGSSMTTRRPILGLMGWVYLNVGWGYSKGRN